MSRTDELNKHPNNHDLPSTRNTIDHECSVATETQVFVDGGSEVVAIRQRLDRANM